MIGMNTYEQGLVSGGISWDGLTCEGSFMIDGAIVGGVAGAVGSFGFGGWAGAAGGAFIGAVAGDLFCGVLTK